MSGARVDVVVPTLGRSPWWREALAELVGPGRRVLAVGPADLDPPADVAWLVADAAPFTTACNLGFGAGGADWVALVNDDVRGPAGWLDGLLERLEADPGLTGVQPLITDGGGARVDGAGIAWSARGEARQRGHDRDVEGWAEGEADLREIFGLSGTCCVWRREALERLRSERGFLFDERLASYYEDVELAGALRRRGHRVAVDGAIRVRHLGSATGTGLGRRRWALIHGNRHLVLARLLGRRYPMLWPRWWIPDLRDLIRRPGRRLGILQGAFRALTHLRHFAHWGPPLEGMP